MNSSVTPILRRVLTPWSARMAPQSYLERCRESFLALDDKDRQVILREAEVVVAGLHSGLPLFCGEDRHAAMALVAMAQMPQGLDQGTREAVQSVLTGCPFIPWRTLAQDVASAEA